MIILGPFNLRLCSFCQCTKKRRRFGKVRRKSTIYDRRVYDFYLKSMHKLRMAQFKKDITQKKSDQFLVSSQIGTYISNHGI